MNLKLSSINMRNRHVTLFQAAKEHEMDQELVNILMLAINKEIGLLTGNVREEIKISNEDPALPETISINSLEQTVHEHQRVLQRLIDEGFVNFKNSRILITSDFITILNRAAEIQKNIHKQVTFQYIMN